MYLSANYSVIARARTTPVPLYMSHPHVNLSRIHVDLARLLHAQGYPSICKMHAKV